MSRILPTTRRDDNPWLANADALAQWAGAMVVMWLAHGRYRPIDKRGDRRPAYTLRRKATLEILRRHFRGQLIIGLHPISPRNRSRWFTIDIDDHSLTGEKSAANRAAAVAWYGMLRSRGFNPLLTESSPGSFHLVIRLDRELASETAYRFGQWIVCDWQERGLSSTPETFPKQPRLNPPRVKYGNWLRLPGMHHTHDWWSRAYDGSEWLDSAGTVNHILSIVGDSPDLIPHEARDFRPRVVERRRRIRSLADSRLPLELHGGFDLQAGLGDLDEDVRQHVTSVAARMQPGQRNALTFELFRRVRSTPLGQRPLGDHLPMFTTFFQLCIGRQRTMSFHECWSDYCRAADFCRCPWRPSSAGGPLERAIEAANAIPVTQLPTLRRCREPTRRLAAVCQLLANHSAQRDFGLPQYALAEMLGVSQPVVSKQVSRLLRLGVIERCRLGRWGGVGGVGEYATYRLLQRTHSTVTKKIALTYGSN